MDAKAVLLAPVRIPGLAVRALDDLHVIGERARREPDPVEEVRGRLDALMTELVALVAVVGQVIGVGRQLNVTAAALDASAQQVVIGAEGLLDATQRLHVTAREIVAGGRELTEVGRTLDAHTLELIDGGAELTQVAKSLDSTLRVFRGALPRMLEGLDTVEQLESAVETVADTVEPLQGAAARVGRATKRLSGSRK